MESVLKAMSKRKESLQPGLSSLNGMLSTATGREMRIQRVVEGLGTVNVLDIARYFQPLGTFLGMTYPVWAHLLIYASDLTISQFGKIMQYTAPFKENVGHELAAGIVMEKAGAVLDNLPSGTRTFLNMVGYQYGGQMSQATQNTLQTVIAQTAAEGVKGAMSYAASGTGTALAGIGAMAAGAVHRVRGRQP